MQDFFEKYPDAKLPVFKVGEEVFLNHAEEFARVYGVRKNLKVEEITEKPASKGSAKAKKDK